MKQLRVKHRVIASAIMVWSFGFLCAQNELCLASGANLYAIGSVAQDPTLYVGGSTTVSAGASMVNQNGRIRYTGSVVNAGTYVSTGYDQFYGASDQEVSGISGSSYFGTLQRAQSAGARIVCLNNTDVDALDLGASTGFIDVGLHGATLWIKNPSSASLLNYAANRYVDVGNGSEGFLARTVSDTTPGHSYLFPIGTTYAGYQRMDVQVVSLGATGPGTVSATFKNGSPGSISFAKHYSYGFSGPSGGACSPGTHSQWVQFSCLRPNYWTLFGSADYRYSLSVPAFGCGSKPNRVIGSPTGTGAWTANVENTVHAAADDLCAYTDWSNNSSGIIPGGVYQGFAKDFAIAGGTATALPVTLVSFEAVTMYNAFVRCMWETASETDNQGFMIERSTDSKTWISIGDLVPAKSGAANERTDYSVDDYVSPGTFYYRLKQIDLDGAETYSLIRSVVVSGDSKLSWRITPNPVSTTLSIDLSLSDEDSVSYCVMDAIGRTVMSGSAMTDGRQIVTVDMSSIPPGIYIVSIMTGHGRTISPVVKQ